VLLSWSTILYGAVLSAIAAAALVAALIRPRQLSLILTVAAGALLGPLAWNAILRATHGTNFFHDAPITLLPASWQDTGSGVFTIALTALALGFGPLSAAGTGRRLATAATLAGLAAFLVDVYLY
jgi:hypothetical protein